MASGVYIGMSSALASQQRLEIAANNIANADTVGFRQQRAVFEEYLVRNLDGRQTAKGGVSLTQTELDRSSGELQQTGNPLDLALSGDGFFAIRGPAGTMVTRAGNFRIDSDGALVDAAGMDVLAGSAETGLNPVVVRPEDGPVRVLPDGTLEQAGTPLASLAIVTVDGPLRPTGGAHLSPEPDSIRDATGTTVTAGYLENSNVNPVRAMVELIEISQDYQSSQKLMSEFRKLDRKILDIQR